MSESVLERGSEREREREREREGEIEREQVSVVVYMSACDRDFSYLCACV